MKAIVTVGLPGCGKSTYAGTLAPDYQELNMDALRAEVSGDASNQDATSRAFGRRRRLLARYAQEGRDLVISDTHARRRDRSRMIKELRQLGYQVEIVFFDVGEATCLARNALRERRVPHEAIQRMARRLRETPPGPHEADAFRVITHGPDRLMEAPGEAAAQKPGRSAGDRPG